MTVNLLIILIKASISVLEFWSCCFLHMKILKKKLRCVYQNFQQQYQNLFLVVSQWPLEIAVQAYSSSKQERRH